MYVGFFPMLLLPIYLQDKLIGNNSQFIPIYDIDMMWSKEYTVYNNLMQELKSDIR